MTTTISAAELRGGTCALPSPARAEAAAHHAVRLAVGATILEVRFADEAAAARYAARFSDLRTDAEPTLRHYVMPAADGRLAFWSPGDAGWSWPYGALPPDAVAFLADATSIASAVRHTPGLASFHAGAVGSDGIAAAIAGDSHAGKTTTTIACGARGMRVYSDERCLVQDGVVLPFPRTLNIRRDGLRRLRESGAPCANALPHAGADETSMPISALFGAHAVGRPAPLAAVFLLSGVASVPRVEPADWQAATAPLGRWMDTAARGMERGAQLVRILRGVRCLRLVLGDPDATALLVRETLARIAADRDAV